MGRPPAYTRVPLFKKIDPFLVPFFRKIGPFLGPSEGLFQRGTRLDITGKRYSGTLNTHFFYRQLNFRSQPGSCLAILENGLETELTLSAKTCLNDSSQSELSFGTKISMRNQIF